MTIEVINFKNKQYPLLQALGNASQFSIPYAKHFCKGKGVDVGCMKKEWSFPGSIPIDLNFNDDYHANNLPFKDLDYIYSSHCLEHVENYVEVMEYWYDCLREKGVLFLYLPDYSQEYWRPWNNKKHLHVLTPTIIKDFMEHLNYKKIYVSGVDINNSFMVVGEK